MSSQVPYPPMSTFTSTFSSAPSMGSAPDPTVVQPGSAYSLALEMQRHKLKELREKQQQLQQLRQERQPQLQQLHQFIQAQRQLQHQPPTVHLGPGLGILASTLHSPQLSPPSFRSPPRRPRLPLCRMAPEDILQACLPRSQLCPSRPLRPPRPCPRSPLRSLPPTGSRFRPRHSPPRHHPRPRPAASRHHSTTPLPSRRRTSDPRPPTRKRRPRAREEGRRRSWCTSCPVPRPWAPSPRSMPRVPLPSPTRRVPPPSLLLLPSPSAPSSLGVWRVHSLSPSSLSINTSTSTSTDGDSLLGNSVASSHHPLLMYSPQ